MGKNILRELVDSGAKVRCLVRPGSESKVAGFGVETYSGDVTDYDSLVAGMKGCDCVINLVGIIREDQKKGITFERLHYLGTKNCVDAASVNGIRRFIQMSALGARENAVTKYHTTKYAAEQYVRASGLNYTIFRPSIIFGKEDKFLNYFAEMVKKYPAMIVFGDGQYMMQPVSVINVAQFYARSVNNENAFNKTFSLCGPKRYTYNELLDCAGKTVNLSVSKIHIPLFLSKAIVWTLGGISSFPITYEQLIMLLENNICDEKTPYEMFGITPVPLDCEI